MKLNFWENLDDSMKRLIYIIIVVIIGIILFFLAAKIVIGNSDSYKKMENTLKNAAISYYSHNKELLPKEDGNEISIDATQLESEGYLKPFDKYNKQEGSNCNGQVFVANNNGHYLYSPNLNCTEYKTTTLAGEILKQQKVVVEGNGLYQVGKEYIYRGEYVNNYVTFGAQTWRILKIDENGYVKLVQTKSKNRSSFDDRYNVKIDNYYGINDFEISRAKEELSVMYKDEEIFTDKEREKIASKNLCIGKRTGNEKTNDGSLECSVLSEDKYPLGLIQLNEAINASIDDNCITPFSTSCSNYNYLSKVVSSTWTITGYSKDTYETFAVFRPNIKRCNNIKKILATLYLSNRLLYTSGTGTLEDPYVIE